MSTPPAHGHERVLASYIGPLDADGLATPDHVSRWWKKDRAFDETLRTQFGEDHRAAGAGERDDWLTTPRGRLAFVILLDQFSRNMFRDTAAMFESDARARAVAKDALAQNDDHHLQVHEQMFLGMPLMHSESLADQDHSVDRFRTLLIPLTGRARAAMSPNLDFALRHRDIVARFGRFPHRNVLLGRTSTEAEIAFLKEPGSAF